MLLSLLLRRQVNSKAPSRRTLHAFRPSPRRAVLLTGLPLACQHRCRRRRSPRQVVLLSVLCHQVARMRLVQVALLSLLGQFFSVSQTSSGSPV